MDEQFPPICPECGSNEVDYEKQSEYTGGGYADFWYEFWCEHCGHEWRSETNSGYA